MSRFIEKVRSRPGLAAVGALVLISAGGAIAAVSADCERIEAMAPANPVRIGSLAAATPDGHRVVTVRGRIVQMFGSHAVLNDGSGQIVVDAGPGGGEVPLAVGQTISAQGRYDNGMLRARYLVGSDGSVTALGGGRHRGERHSRRGADDRPESVPAPSAAAASNTPTSGPTAATNTAEPAR